MKLTLQAIGEMIGARPVNAPDQLTVNNFRIDDDAKQWNAPLQLAVLENSGHALVGLQLLDQTLLEIAGVSPRHRRKPPSKVTGHRVQADATVLGGGFGLAHSTDKFIAINFQGDCKYSAAYKEGEITNLVMQHASQILSAARSTVGTVTGAHRFVIGVLTDVVTGNLELVSYNRRNTNVTVQMESGKLKLDAFVGGTKIHDSDGVSAVGIKCKTFIFEQLEDEKWRVSQPINVDSYDTPLYDKAAAYCHPPKGQWWHKWPRSGHHKQEPIDVTWASEFEVKKNCGGTTGWGVYVRFTMHWLIEKIVAAMLFFSGVVRTYAPPVVGAQAWRVLFALVTLPIAYHLWDIGQMGWT